MSLDFKDSQMNVNLLKDSELTAPILYDMKMSNDRFIQAITEEDDISKEKQPLN